MIELSSHRLLVATVAFVRCLVPIYFATLCLCVFASHCQANGTEEQRAKGAKIYEESCSHCHGNSGEGVEGAYETPLVGDFSIGQLAKVISDTMPEDEAETCVGEDAEAVAAYMHHTFYSEAAQIRNRPPQLSPQRLTAEQLRQSLADIYASQHWRPGAESKRGLNAEYYKTARQRKSNLVIERVDPSIDFDFGKDAPVEGVEAEEFVISWRGGMLVESSGRYELSVDSTCSFTLDFGNYDRRLIDNHVQSGDKTSFRRTLNLTGGRIYPFELLFVQRKRKTESPPARIQVSWTPPNSEKHIIPERNWIPGWHPPTFSLQTQLPPDDRSYGYERGIQVSRQWDDAVTSAALEFAEAARDELWESYKREHKKEKKESRQLMAEFLEELLEAAFRQELTDELRQLYVTKQLEKEADDGEAIKRVVLLGLKSPRFLYPTAHSAENESRRIASRLALILFDSLPADDWLSKAATDDKLKTEESVRQFVRSRIRDYRVRAKTLDMLHAWLNTNHFTDVSKSAEKYPQFNEELLSDLRASFDTFLNTVVWEGTGDFRELFTANWSLSNDRIAKTYGEQWQPIEKGEERHAGLRKTAELENFHGILTHPFLLSGLAYHDSTSPIHRGVFLIRYMLGRNLRPPQEAFSPLSPDLHPDLTTRERVEVQTSPESCQVCHSRINGLGFALENYDAIGLYRQNEGDKAIDSQGSYTDRGGEDIKFNGAAELANYLVSSHDAHRAFVNRAFQHFVKQPPAAYGADTIDKLTEKFLKQNCNIPKLIEDICVVASLGPKGDDVVAIAKD